MAQPRNILKNLRIKDWLTVVGAVTADSITSASAVVSSGIIGGAASNAATSGVVVCPLTELYSGYTTNATADITIALADGVAGQLKIIKAETINTNDVVITPTHLADGASLTLDTTGDLSVLVFDGTEWQIVYSTATLA